jgi:hypothetical protein
MSDVTTALHSLLASPSAPMADISTLLDSTSAEARCAALFSLSKSQQRALYERAAASTTLTLDDLVPPGASALTPVVHRGKNSLPVFRDFEKHMCRPNDGSARIFGFNEGFTRQFIGPGYFVAMPTGLASDGAPSWAARGGVVVDYFQVPNTTVASGWPAVVDNSAGLQRFVYRGMRDYLRKVSTHASIGAAYQGERAFNSWFILCRD